MAVLGNVPLYSNERNTGRVRNRFFKSKKNKPIVDNPKKVKEFPISIINEKAKNKEHSNRYS